MFPAKTVLDIPKVLRLRKLISVAPLFLFIIGALFPFLAAASTVNYHGRILRPDGNPVQNLSVEFRIQIRTPGLENCLMYEETLTAPVVNGLFSLPIGINNRTDSFSTWNFDRVFSNRSTFNLTSPECSMTSDYAPAPGEGRMISVQFRESALGSYESMPRQALNYAPMSIESRFVSGYGSGSLLKIEGVDHRTTLSGAQLSELVSLTTGNYVRSSNSTGAVVPVLSGNASGAVAGSIWYDSSAGQLKYSDGTMAQVVGSASGGSGGITSINGLTALTQTFATIGTSGASPNWASSGSTHTLHIPLASSPGVSGGLISTTQFDSFNAKLGSVLNAGQIFVGNTGNIATPVTPSGDVALAGNGVTTLTAIRGQAVDATVPVEGQVFRWTTSTKWTPAFLSMADVRSTATPGNTIFPTTSCTTGQTLNWSSLSDTFVCNSIAISNSQVSYGSALTAGSVLAAPAGSTGAPSFRALVASDLPAGVSSQWATSGANIFYGTGNVGIGTTSPGVDLEIGGTTGLRSRGKLAVDFGSATSSAYIELTGRNAGSANVTHMYANPQGDLVLQSNISRAVTLGTNTTEFMRVDGNGSVGIGTNAPSAKLQVASTGASPFAMEVLQSGGSGTPIVGITSFGTSSPLLQMSQARGSSLAPTATQAFDTIGVIQGQGFGGSSVYGGPTIQFAAEANFSSTSLPSVITFQTIPSGSTGVVERMRIASNGNVGIGTNNPSGLLSLATTTTPNIFVQESSTGGSQIFQATSGAYNQMIQMRSNPGYSAVNADEQIGGFEYRAVDTNFTQRQPAGFFAYADGAATNGSVPGRLIFSTAPSGSASALERVRITSLGNVGIGSSNPAYKLDVTGDINASATVRAAGVVLTSDIRFKRDIKVLDSSLAKILRLRGVRYKWRTEEFPNRHFNHRDQVGVIAQEVEAEFPELVDTAADGFKAVNYSALVAPLIESTKEVYGLCSAQEVRIADLERDLSKMKEVVNKLSHDNDELRSRLNRLEMRLLSK